MAASWMAMWALVCAGLFLLASLNRRQPKPCRVPVRSRRAPRG